MLNFFRAYQRYFFVIITAMIVISFSFFGTFTSMATGDSSSSRTDVVIGKKVDGSALMRNELEDLKRFLATSLDDRDMIAAGKIPNVLNDGVVRKDFLQTGLASLLALRHFDTLKGDLEARCKKAQAFKPYSHPQAAFVSAESAWQRFIPALNTQLAHLQNTLQKTEPLTSAIFSELAELYVAQTLFPSDILRRVLLNQQKQYSWMQPDPALPSLNISLFGFQSLEDWFGPQFLDIVSTYILNAACLADSQGISVSETEVRADLLKNGSAALQLLGEQETQKPDLNVFLRNIGFDGRTAVKTWKNVLLFRKLFEGCGNTVALDALTKKSLSAYANASAQVELYQLPQELRLTDFRSMLKLQLYIDAVCRKTKKTGQASLILPSTLLSPEEADKAYPELVHREFQLEYTAIKKEDLTARVALKETWEWELVDANWALLEKEFPTLAKAKGKTREEMVKERLAALDSVPADGRLKIDQFARAKIVAAHPEWINDMLQHALPKQVTLGLRVKGGVFPFEGIADRAAFIKLLETAPLKEEGLSPVSNSLALNQSSDDGHHYYRIQVLKRTPAKEILSFAVALRDGTLDQLLDRQLESAYPDMRKKDLAAFLIKEGEWKPFKDVRDQVGAHVYADLLAAIKESSVQEKTVPQGDPQGEWTLDTYPRYRLYSTVKETKKALERDPESTLTPALWIRHLGHLGQPGGGQSGDEYNLKKQWCLNKSTTTLKRASAVSFSKEELFAKAEGSNTWSSVFAPANGDITFFRVIGNADAPAIAETVTQVSDEKEEALSPASGLLSIDAKRALMQQLIRQMDKKSG